MAKKRVKVREMSLPEAAKFLDEAGLIWLFNVSILHPLGLSLSVVRDRQGKASFGPLRDCRDDPGECYYEDADHRAGYDRVMAYLQERGVETTDLRKKLAGYVRQKDPR